jgi:uncharacterized protein (DUF885 family)
MRNIILLLLACLFFIIASAQSKTKAIDPALKAIRDFQDITNKRDSILGQPLGSRREEDILRSFQFYDSLNTELNKIDLKKLSFDEQINLELLKYSIEDDVYSYKYKAYLNPILADEGFHTSLAGMASMVPSTKKELDDYLRRLKDIPRFVDENLALMRKGLKMGISQPRAILDGYENTYTLHIVDNPGKSIFSAPFSKKPVAVSDEDWKKITEEGNAVIRDQVTESYRKIKTFFDTEYLPGTRTTIGVSNFPEGIPYYEELVRHYTTTNLTYEEVYRIGLKEVERIKNEMLEVKNKVNFTGTLQQFIYYLRNDKQFYATTPEQLLKEASFIAKKADGMLPQFFGKLPRQPYGVQPVPDHLAPTYTAGRYSGAPISSKRAGNYWVNTYDLKSRPLYALESLTLHEAVPGHHLQISLTQELDSLPPFRRNLYVNAFGEGWGLYCEYLGAEMGFYKEPYTLFGRLTYDMWRACRLVIDVGLHTRKWSKEDAVKYLSENTALSLHEVNTEINRYISWPGQALAYKIGELKIKELRKRAEEQLKDKFDIRSFHDLILSQGTVTLNIMEMMVDRYIGERLNK